MKDLSYLVLEINQLLKKEEFMDKTKPFSISKQIVLEAFNKVKANKGSYGIDDQTIGEYEQNLKNNLYKLWNRMSSGTYLLMSITKCTKF